MTARDLIHILLEIDPDTPIVMMDSDDIRDICFGASDIVELTDGETGQPENVFVISPCFCNHGDIHEDDCYYHLPEEVAVKANDFNIDLN